MSNLLDWMVYLTPCGCGSKSMYPKWNPGKWKHGPKPAVHWWFDFDPHPCGGNSFPARHSSPFTRLQKESEVSQDTSYNLETFAGLSFVKHICHCGRGYLPDFLYTCSLDFLVVAWRTCSSAVTLSDARSCALSVAGSTVAYLSGVAHSRGPCDAPCLP